METAIVFSPRATLLGGNQETWLYEQLLSSRATWNILAQQIMMGRADVDPAAESKLYSMDQWSGYEVPRNRLFDFLQSQQIANPIVLTGDIHANWVNELKSDFDRPESPTIATEFVCTSISSGGNGFDKNEKTEMMLSQNPFVKFHNNQRGYTRCHVTRDRWISDYQVLDFVDKPGSPIKTRASFVVENGKKGVERS
jgi:alkaline phosphatase D